MIRNPEIFICRKGSINIEMGKTMAKRRMKEKEAIILSGILGFVILLMASPFWAPMIWGSAEPRNTQVVSDSAVKVKEKEEETRIPQNLPVVDESGMTLGSRINPPGGYTRIAVEEKSLGDFLRNYELKKQAGAVKMWDGTKKKDSGTVQAVFKLPMEKEDMQRAAGAIIRMYAEYFWSRRMFDKISFQFINGFQAEYQKWQEGFRIRTDSTGSIWVNGSSYDESKENLKEYLHVVLTYTSAESMKKESEKIKWEDLQIGDVFLQSGDTSDVAMIVDVCENEQGQKAFLLAKGGNPAQQFHLLKNPAHDDDPWYYAGEMQYPFQTAEGEFAKGSLRRLKYLEGESDGNSSPDTQ